MIFITYGDTDVKKDMTKLWKALVYFICLYCTHLDISNTFNHAGLPTAGRKYESATKKQSFRLNELPFLSALCAMSADVNSTDVHSVMAYNHTQMFSILPALRR